MSEWTSGYVVDIGYTFGYYPELNPLRLRLAFLHAGLVAPAVGSACELGFGQGMSVNLHAAASVTQWSGTDFNPSQAGFARELAAASGAGAELYNEAFAEFSNRPDLPDFDYIGLHGIWSWVSDENRSIIVDFIRRKLKVGGVLYISYNTQPGWAPMVPMRDLLTEHCEIMGVPGGGIVPRIDGALAFSEKLLATNPAYARANPNMVEWLKKIKEKNRSYLAHEYFNRDWMPMSFSTMAGWLMPTKLSYACSAHYFDHVDAVNLTTEQQAFLNEIPDSMFRETVRDFMVNQQFRRDYWVKGARRLNATEQSEALCNQRVILVEPRGDVSFKVTGALGEATLQEAVYGPILDELADHRPKTLAQIEWTVKSQNIGLGQIVQAALLLIGSGRLAAVQDDELIAKARKRTDKINAFLCNRARGSDDITHLASPVTGGGVAVDRFRQLFLLANSHGKKYPAEWAQFAWQILAAQNQKITREGKVLESADECLMALGAHADVFAEKQLPILNALGIV